ncbi:uncharacterized protein LOC111251451 [Varroa destructor]|uniref:Uncharacterized protein n=1 Tax=Varroa destructor TaxID=109461 RepID=A0A7M7KCK5_VARDE|nr:uncharacterized protein LOC111251451 [Varroa destructor]
MRTSVATLIMLLVMLAATPGSQSVLELGATQGLVSLGTNLATLMIVGSGVVCTGFQVPLTVFGPLKLPFPVAFGLKRFGFIKLRLLLSKLSPRAAARFDVSGILPYLRIVQYTAVPNVMGGKPEVGAKGKSTTPEPPQATYRPFREVARTLPITALRRIFREIEEFDPDRCVLRVLCELAVDPTLAEDFGKDVMAFLKSLDNSDSTAPWVKFQKAIISGQLTQSRKACYRKYNGCAKPTKTFVVEARKRLIGSSTS